MVMVLEIKRVMNLCKNCLVAKQHGNEYSHTVRLCTLDAAEVPRFASPFIPQCVKYYFKQIVRSTSADYQ
jgi:hypothetical protein